MRDQRRDPIEVLLLNSGEYSPFRVDEAFQSMASLSEIEDQLSYVELYELLKLETLKVPRLQRAAMIKRLRFLIKRRFEQHLDSHIEYLQERSHGWTERFGPSTEQEQ